MTEPRTDDLRAAGSRVLDLTKPRDHFTASRHPECATCDRIEAALASPAPKPRTATGLRAALRVDIDTLVRMTEPGASVVPDMVRYIALRLRAALATPEEERGIDVDFNNAVGDHIILTSRAVGIDGDEQVDITGVVVDWTTQRALGDSRG